MTMDQWQRIKDILQAAQECEPQDRLKCVESLCQEDQALRHEVESLLRYESDCSQFLNAPSSNDVAILFKEHQADALVGQHIGKFTITGILGFGGMSVVYRATQPHPHREVGLKVVRAAGLSGKRQIRLLEREIKSLALLKHSGIASIYEAGTTDDGDHYFAMELIRGKPLTEHAEDRRLSISDRLQMFCRVCEAIHYAHQRGIIHRDIKPSNILVSENHNPKVLDFGLAKIMDKDITMTSIATEQGKIQGTLSYMSPEQTRGVSDDIDIRSDVYSLGVMLYELLTNQRPYDVSRLTVPQAIDLICYQSPLPAGKIVPSLRGDLEIIIRKALEKEPERRYQSADALAADIKRYLVREPISARKPSAIYQLRKLAARHKIPATLTAILFLAITILAILATSLSFRLAHQRDEALLTKQNEMESRKSAEEVVDFMVGLFEQGIPETVSKTMPSVRDIVDQGTEKIQTELVDQPLVQARLMIPLGKVYARLNEHELADTLLNHALQIRKEKLDPNHPDIANSLIALNELCLATHDFDEGYEYLKQARGILESRYSDTHESVLVVIDSMGANRYYARDHTRAVEHYQELLSRKKKVFDPDSAEITQTQSDLGTSLLGLRKIDEAESLLRKTLETEKRVLGDHIQTSFSLDNLAHAVYAKGDSITAEALVKERVEMLRRIVHENHPTLTHALGNYAVLVQKNHGAARAEPIMREVLAKRIISLGDETQGVADALMKLGNIHLELNDANEAVKLFKEALHIRTKLFGPAEMSSIESTCRLATAYVKLQQFRKAEQILLENYKTLHTEEPQFAELINSVTDSLVELYLAWNENEPDRQFDQKADIWRSKYMVKPDESKNLASGEP